MPPLHLDIAGINQLNAKQLLTILNIMPDQYKRCILTALLQRGTNQNRLEEYLDDCKAPTDLLKQSLFHLKQRGLLYVIAEVFKTKYKKLSELEGLREQDLLESAQDLIAQKRIEPAKRFLLINSNYRTELLQIYEREYGLELQVTGHGPMLVLRTLEQAQREAEEGDVYHCKDSISQALRIAQGFQLPPPNTRWIEKMMYVNAISFRLYHAQQLLNQDVLSEHNLYMCRTCIRMAEQFAEEGELSEPKIEELRKRYEEKEGME